MSKTLKSVISICLVMVLVFGVFTAPIMQPKAEAIAITATSSMIAIGVAMLTMLGITFASTDAAKQASKGLIEGSKDIFDWIDNLSLQGGPNGEPPENWTKFTLGGAMSAGFATFVNKAKQLFGNSKNSGSVHAVDSTSVQLGNMIIYSSVDGYSSQELYSIAPYSDGEISSLILNGVNVNFYLDDGYLLKNGETILVNGWAFALSRGSYTAGTIFDYRFGHYTYLENGRIYLNHFIAYKAVRPDGSVYYNSNFYNGLYDNNVTDITTEYLAPVYTQVPYQNISPYELNIIYNALAEKLKTQEVTFDYTDILDQMNNNADQQLQVSQDQLLEQAQIKDLLEQIKAGQGETTKTEIQESDLDVPEVPHDLTWKFPFCVPFDLIALVGALNATPKDPKWEIPFHIESLGFDDSIELDLTKFEPVTQVLRVVMTIFFLLGLTVVTRKMIKG